MYIAESKNEVAWPSLALEIAASKIVIYNV